MVNRELRGRAAKGLILLSSVCGVALMWYWSPLRAWVNFETLSAWEHSFSAHPAAPYIVIGAYLVGALVLFPITLLTAVTIFTFGPILGNLYSVLGWLLSAAFGYAMGRLLGREWLVSLMGQRFERLGQEAKRNGLLAVTALRVVPIAPFTVMNLFIGASRFRFHDFVFGSLLGRLPGMLVLTVFGVQLKSLLGAPALGKLVLLTLVLVSGFLAHRWFSRQFLSPVAIPPDAPNNTIS